jgi:hypothetical protein
MPCGLARFRTEMTMSQDWLPQVLPGQARDRDRPFSNLSSPAAPVEGRAILERLRLGYYDRPDVLDHTARLLLGDLVSGFGPGAMDQDQPNSTDTRP